MSGENNSQGAWLKVFCPNARCLTDEEVASLPPEKLKSAEGKSGKGLWLEIFCPEGTCDIGPQNFWTVEETRDPSGDKGLWLKLFCPEGSCEISEPSGEV
jgi:hypothetical protein